MYAFALIPAGDDAALDALAEVTELLEHLPTGATLTELTAEAVIPSDAGVEAIPGWNVVRIDGVEGADAVAACIIGHAMKLGSTAARKFGSTPAGRERVNAARRAMSAGFHVREGGVAPIGAQFVACAASAEAAAGWADAHVSGMLAEVAEAGAEVAA